MSRPHARNAICIKWIRFQPIVHQRSMFKFFIMGKDKIWYLYLPLFNVIPKKLYATYIIKLVIQPANPSTKNLLDTKEVIKSSFNKTLCHVLQDEWRDINIFALTTCLVHRSFSFYAKRLDTYKLRKNTTELPWHWLWIFQPIGRIVQPCDLRSAWKKRNYY